MHPSHDGPVAAAGRSATCRLRCRSATERWPARGAVDERGRPPDGTHPATTPGRRIERPQIERMEVELATGLRIGGEQDLEPAIEQEPPDGVRSDTSTHGVAGFEHCGVQTRGRCRPGAGQAGEAGADDHHVGRGGDCVGHRRRFLVGVALRRRPEHRAPMRAGCSLEPIASGLMEQIAMPQLGETVTEGTITRWLKQVGDPVAVDDPLFEVSTDKVDTEVPSAYAGFLRAILVPEGDTVPIGTPLAVHHRHRRRADRPTPPTAPSPPPAAPPAACADRRPVRRARAAAASAAPDRRNGTAFLSPVVRRLLDEHGLDPAEVVGSGRDGRITRNDVLAAAANRRGAAATGRPRRRRHRPVAPPAAAPDPTTTSSGSPGPGAPPPSTWCARWPRRPTRSSSPRSTTRRRPGAPGGRADATCRSWPAPWSTPSASSRTSTPASATTS